MPPLRLVLPHIAGLVLIGIVWVSPPDTVYAHIPVVQEILDIYIPVQYTIVVRIILSIIILSLVLLIHLLRDYADFIPKSWDMRVFFDEDELEQLVKSFSAEEREKLCICEDWKPYRNQYIKYFNQLLRRYEVPDYAFFDDHTLGIGEFQYKYRKIPGRQRYRLYGGKGVVDFKFSTQEETTTIEIQFDQIEKEADDVKPSLADLLYRFNIVVAPTFRQYVWTGPHKQHRLVAIKSPTKISFFPSIEVSRTLYLADIRELRSEIGNLSEKMNRYMVPVCFAVNLF